MKTIKELLEDINLEIQDEIIELRKQSKKGILGKAKRLRQLKLESYLKMKNIAMDDYILLGEYLKFMANIKPNDKVKVKQMELV